MPANRLAPQNKLFVVCVPWAAVEVVSDSYGNLYTGEVETGKRVQKFVRVHRNPAR
jgi:hypothetical protein